MEFWGDLIREVVNKGLIILSITTFSSSLFYVVITVEYKVIADSVPSVLNHRFQIFRHQEEDICSQIVISCSI